MLVSTKGRYALRVMIDLAMHEEGRYVPLKEMADRQDISQKYMEAIMTQLSKAHLVEAHHGKGGGYKLIRDPKEYRISEILEVTESSLAPVSCLRDDADPCPKADKCITLPMWKELYKVTKEYLDSVTLEALKGDSDVDINCL
jgi:Rrf2 family protein